MMPDSHLNPDSNPWQYTDNHSVAIITFDVLQILGLISISATLFIVLFFRIRRSIAWFSFLLSWGFSSIGYLLIVGRQTGPSPDSILCLSQSMFIYAFPALCGLTFVGLALEIFLTISYPASICRVRMVTLYLVPYVVFVGVLITVGIFGHFNPTAVLRGATGMYCYVSIHIPLLISSAIVICCMIISLILGVCITLKCRRHCSASRTLLSRNGTSFSLILRLGLIAVCAILAMGMAFIKLFDHGKNEMLSVCGDLTLAALPVAVGILFGTQRDILYVLMFWRKPPPILPVTSSGSEIITTSTETQSQNINDSFKSCKY